MLLYETRSLAEPPEIRSDAGRLVASGVAIRYGVRSKPILGRFVEEIRAGAATKTMQERDVLALHEHERSMMLGRTSSGTLRLTDSATELRYEIDLPDTGAGRDVAALMERGDLKGSSFGFRANPKMTTWSVDKGMAVRSVGEMSLLHHIATTVDPAYNETSAEVAYRSLADASQLDLRSIIEAAERGDLAKVIEADELPPVEEEDEERSAAQFRRPASWFV